MQVKFFFCCEIRGAYGPIIHQVKTVPLITLTFLTWGKSWCFFVALVYVLQSIEILKVAAVNRLNITGLRHILLLGQTAYRMEKGSITWVL